MASAIYDEFIAALTAGELDLQSSGTSYGVLLVDPNYSFDPTHEFVEDITNELTDASYGRKDTLLSSFVLLPAGAGFTFSWADVTWSGLSSVVGVAGAVLYFYTDINDSGTFRPLVFFPLTDLPAMFANTNYTVQFPTAVKIYGT